jgi:phage terminase large subunit
LIEFKSYDNQQDAKSGKRDILFVNEVNGIKKVVYDELADRTTEKIVVDYNPTSKFWVHDHLLNEPHVIRLISNYRHNKFITESVRRKIERHKDKNPQRWRVYGLGLTGQLEGAIFKNVTWINKDQVPPINHLRKFAYGLDLWLCQ